MKSVRIISVILPLIIGTGCAHNPPDIGAFTWFDMNHGAGTKIFTAGRIDVDQTKTYNGENWPTLIKNGIHIQHDDYLKLEEWLIDYCKKKPNCSQNYLEGLQNVFKRIDELNAQ